MLTYSHVSSTLLNPSKLAIVDTKLIFCCYHPLSRRVFGGESSAAQFEHLTELQRGAVFKAALQDFNERAMCGKANEADQAHLSATAAEKEALALILDNEGEVVSDAEVLMLLRQDIWPETLHLGYHDARTRYFECKIGADRDCRAEGSSKPALHILPETNHTPNSTSNSTSVQKWSDDKDASAVAT